MGEHRTRRYKGTSPYLDAPLDRKVFFGRDRESRSLFSLVLAEDLVVVFAKSGMGKTSLINAGLVEPLRERGYFPCVVRVNDTKAGPVRSVLDGVIRDAERTGVDCGDPDDTSLWHFFKTAELWSERNDLLRPVLVIDQFEELFTLYDAGQREAFIAAFAELVRGRSRRPEDSAGTRLDPGPPALKIVLALREDFLADLQELAAAVPGILQHRFRVGPLTRAGAKDAILGPARLDDEDFATAPFSYHEQAIDEILDFLGRRRKGAETVQEDAVEPVQLQLMCQYLEELVQARQASGSPSSVQITSADLGGERRMQQVLERFYERTVASVPRGERRAVRRLCERRLISSSGRRMTEDEEEIRRKYGLSQGTLRALVDARLLRSEPRLGGTFYELAHDTLVQPILQARKRRRKKTWNGVKASALVLWLLGMGISAASLFGKEFVAIEEEPQLTFFRLGTRDAKGEWVHLGRDPLYVGPGGSKTLLVPELEDPSGLLELIPVARVVSSEPLELFFEGPDAWRAEHAENGVRVHRGDSEEPSALLMLRVGDFLSDTFEAVYLDGDSWSIADVTIDGWQPGMAIDPYGFALKCVVESKDRPAEGLLQHLGTVGLTLSTGEGSSWKPQWTAGARADTLEYAFPLGKMKLDVAAPIHATLLVEDGAGNEQTYRFPPGDHEVRLVTEPLSLDARLERDGGFVYYAGQAPVVGVKLNRPARVTVQVLDEASGRELVPPLVSEPDRQHRIEVTGLDAALEEAPIQGVLAVRGDDTSQVLYQDATRGTAEQRLPFQLHDKPDFTLSVNGKTVEGERIVVNDALVELSVRLSGFEPMVVRASIPGPRGESVEAETRVEGYGKEKGGRLGQLGLRLPEDGVHRLDLLVYPAEASLDDPDRFRTTYELVLDTTPPAIWLKESRDRPVFRLEVKEPENGSGVVRLHWELTHVVMEGTRGERRMPVKWLGLKKLPRSPPSEPIEIDLRELVTPGELRPDDYVLSVSAMDAAGNRAESSVRWLHSDR